MPKTKNKKAPEDEIAKRRDEILKRMHKLPPKSQKDYVGDSKKKGKIAPQREQRKPSGS